jgi:hypothetical protein
MPFGRNDKRAAEKETEAALGTSRRENFDLEYFIGSPEVRSSMIMIQLMKVNQGLQLNSMKDLLSGSDWALLSFTWYCIYAHGSCR